MSKVEEHQEVAKFLQRVHTGILSTVDTDGKPWGSAVYFVIDDDFNTYFVTRVGTKKYQNILAHPDIALTVVDSDSQTTVQIAGPVSKLPAHEYKDIVFDKLASLRPKHHENWAPPIEKVHQGDYIALKISPTTLQYSDYSKAYTDYNQNFIEKII